MRQQIVGMIVTTLTVTAVAALAQAPRDDDDTYAINRNTYKKSANAADLNKTLSIKIAMAKLLWPVDLGDLKSPADDPKFREQIKSLQLQMGVQATGSLTFAQDRFLNDAAQMMFERRTHGGIKKPLFRNEEKNYVTAEGSLSMDDMAYPINKAKIECYKLDRICKVSQAELDVKGPRGQLLDVAINTYDVTEFSDTKVIAERISPCGTATLAIDFKSATAKIVDVPDLISEQCQKLHYAKKKSERERIQVVTLVDPWDASAKFYDLRQAEAEKLAYKPNLKIHQISK